VISALALGVSDGKIENLLYIPLSFACWLAPVFGIFYAWTGLFTPKAEAADTVRA
jgi:NhaC family Na+:H+ antiporter